MPFREDYSPAGCEEVIRAVICNEPDDANFGGWDILISVPNELGFPMWVCVAETASFPKMRTICSALESVHQALKDTRYNPVILGKEDGW